MITPLLLALVAAFLTAVGGRDQQLVAALRAKLGRSIPLLSAALFCAALTGCVMAWAGWAVGGLMSASARSMLVAFALLVAALHLVRPVHPVSMKEPTRSLGAVMLVLLTRQIADGPRLVIFAIAVLSGSPIFMAIGGVIGGGAALFLGWSLGEKLAHRLPLDIIRTSVGTVVVLTAALIGLSIRINL